MKLFRLFTTLMLVCFTLLGKLSAQSYEMDLVNGTTINTCSGTFYDSGGSGGSYTNNENYTVTFCSTTANPLFFDFSGVFDIDCSGDTLFAYNGTVATGTPIAILTYLDDNTQTTYSSQLQLGTTSSCVTFRWKSNGSCTDVGWAATISCTAPPTCSGNPPAADIFGQATPICNLSSYCGSTDTYYGEDTPYNLIGGGTCPSPDDLIFGGTIENNSWLSFQANATTASFNFSIPSCTGGGSGVQVGVFGFNGTAFTLQSPCATTDGSQMGNFTVNATGLTVGNTYYIMIDGNTGANCNYTVTANTGVLVANAGTDQTVCKPSATLSAVMPAGNTGTWSVVSGSATFSDANSATSTVTGLSLGTNTLRWTVSGTCATSTDDVVITYTRLPIVAPAVTICQGATMTLSATMTGATAPLTYQWTGPNGFQSSDASPTRTQALSSWTGSYLVTITDTNGCYNTASVSVTVNSIAVDITPTGAATTFCSGQSLTLTAVSANATSFLWSTGATTAAISVNATGDYTVTATGPTGCTASICRHVTVNSAPVVTITGTNPICAGQTTTFTATGGGTYLWSNAQTTAAITANTAGTFTVTVTNGGCTATASVTLTVNSNPTATTSSTNNTNCVTPNGTVTLTTTGTSFVWSNGPTTQNITGLAAGTYTVTVTGAGGCTATASATVTNATVNPTATTATTSNTNCVAPFNGSVTLTTTGTSFVWSNGPSTQNITGLAAGTYTVTVTGAGGCTATASATVTNATVNPTATTATTSNTNCVAPFNGSVTLTTTGTSFVWSNGPSTQNITGLAAGTYTVTVTGAGGCTATASATVTNATVNPTATTATTSNTNCVAPFNGSVTLTTTGTSFVWSNGPTTQNITGLAAGTYTVTVTGAGGCTATASATVTNATVNPTATAAVTNNTNCTSPNGSVTLTTTGTNFVWSNAATTQNITGLAAGTYTVTVTGAGGCTATASATVTNAIVNPTATAAVTNNTNCTSPNGSVTLTTTGTSFLWSNAATTQNITGLTAGTYTVTVTGAGGCTATASATLINATANPTVTTSITNNNNCVVPFNGSVTLTTTGTSFLWSDGRTTQNITGLNGGTYTVTVTGTGGCTATTSATIVNTSINPTATPTVTNNTNCTVPFNGSVFLSTTGTTFIWSNGETVENILAVGAGTYTVTVTGLGGCVTTATATVTNTASNLTILATGNTVVCQGDTTTFSVIGADSYLWSNGATTASITANTAGTYTVTGTATGGCSATTSRTLTVNPLPTITASSNSPVCTGRSIQMSATGALTYAWTGVNGNGSFTATGFAPSRSNATPAYSGIYTVTGTNINGCVSSANVTITVNDCPEICANGIDDDNDGQIDTADSDCPCGN